MPEAGPESPGHVGHTPQHIGEELMAARRQGIFTANLPRYILAFPNRIFPGRLPQLQRGIRNRGPWASLQAIDDYQRRVAAGGHSRFPLAYLEGMEAPLYTRKPPSGGGTG